MVQYLHDLTILVLDDHPAKRLLLTEMLISLGHTVVSASDGEEASKLLDHHGHISLAICDLRMPGLDGLAFLRMAAQRRQLTAVILNSSVDPALQRATKKMIEHYGLAFLGMLHNGYEKQSILELIAKFIPDQPINGICAKVTPQASNEEIMEGLNSGEFIPFFQPKISLDTSRIHSFEALARWKTNGNIRTPAMFSNLFSTPKLSEELFWTVLNKSLTILKSNKKLFRNTPISINMEPSQLSTIGVSNQIIALLAEYQIRPEMLTIEVTESELMNNIGQSMENLTRLRIAGISVSIDDFGTGFSSLKRLISIPFNEIKIDRTFVSSITTDTTSKTIASTIIELSKQLNASAVAEGIETTLQLEALREINCPLGQGYLFSPPMHPEKIADFYAEWEKSHD